MSNAVLRRYTPPTCTLEISAVGSSLSRWTDRTVLKHVRFQLSFDDPRFISDDYVVLRGDRTDLELLCEAVQSYVQRLLDPAASRFDALFDRSLDSRDTAPDGSHSTLTDSPARLQVPNQGVYLEPVSLVNHDLHLGQLATAESGAVVRLSTLQLFDLANALEEYADDAIALPTLNQARWFTPVRVAQVAAMTVAAVGISTSLFQFVVDMSTPVQTASTESEVQVEELPPQEFPTATDLTPPTLVPVPPSPVPGSQLTPGTPAPAAPAPAAPGAPGPAPAFPPVTAAPSIATAPGGSAGQTTTIQPSQPDIISSLPADSALRSNPGTQPGVFTLPEAAQGQSAPATTAFDSIPQVAEARSYFQQRWTPVAELTTVLEYRLVVSPDGSLQQVTPLGQASNLYRDRTGMPALGEAFVSPIESGQTARMRLVLSPEGGVQTFLEALN